MSSSIGAGDRPTPGRRPVIPSVLLPGGGHGPVQVPQLINLVCNAAIAEPAGGICLLLPSPAGMDSLVAVMSAFAHLPEDSSSLATEQITRTFKPGQKVRVLPDGDVYQVAGPCSLYGKDGYFLQFLDAKKGSGSGRFAIWGEDLKRLEPTERSRPLGRDRRQWSPARPTAIDLLCGTRTLGNHALLNNRVMLLGSKSDLEAFLDEIRLIPPGVEGGSDTPLGADFPWGSVDDEGNVFIEHPRSTPGEPLIAATRNFSAARKVGENADAGLLLFVSRWLDGCLQNFETLGRLAERQRVVLLLDAGARHRLSPFIREGWTVWEPDPIDLLGKDAAREYGVRCVDRNVQAARREKACAISWHRTTQESLAVVYRSLREAGDAVRRIESQEEEILDDRVDEQLAELWNLFLDACGWVAAPSEEEHRKYRNRVAEARIDLAILERVVPGDVLVPMKNTLETLTEFLTTHPAGATTPKGEELLSALEKVSPDQLVLGSSRDRDQVRHALEGVFPSERIVAVGELDALGEDRRLVACSLMARNAFSRFFDPCPSSAIDVVAYDFEADIYAKRLQRRAKARRSFVPDRGTRERLTGLQYSDDVEETQAEPAIVERVDHGIERVEVARIRPKYDLPSGARTESDFTREGRLCRFAGCSWAVFTPGHSISVMGQGSGTVIDRKSVDELSVGDRLLIREAGDKDVIRLLAEDMVGPAKYSQLWDTGQRWREALRSVSTNPTKLWQRLSWFGLQRDPVTIRYWLLDDGVIGPRSQDDIAMVVELAGQEPDHPKWKECWQAILSLRSLHMRAGIHLTRVLEGECSDLLFGDFEHEQAVELSLGLVWFVRVEEIQPTAYWPANSVNQLEWGREDWRERMLRNVIVAGES